MKKICPKCGITSEKRKFIGPFCISCYKVRLESPERVEVEYCPRCGRVKRKGEWVKYGEFDVGELILDKSGGDIENFSYSREDGEGTYLVRVGDALIEEKRKINVKWEGNLCRDCSRRAGGYFEVILQLRGSAGKVSKLMEKIYGEIEKRTPVSKVVEQKEGVDFYVVDKSVVDRVLKNNNLKPEKTRKLFSQKDGKRIYRFTYCVRI